MNLIEQLGGYELAKQVFDSVPKDGNSYTVTRDDTGASFHSGEIFKALLEYRRQHNIFEVGDKVVFDAHFCDRHEDLGYGEITYCTMDKRVFEIDKYYLISIDENRHATDAEIEAGKRL